jgi:hypothetical protein
VSPIAAAVCARAGDATSKQARASQVTLEITWASPRGRDEAPHKTPKEYPLLG